MKKFLLHLFVICSAMIALRGVLFAHDDVLFVSQPVLVAQVGQLYEYHAQAISQRGDPITYELRHSPSGMTIHPQTGLVLWTPAQTGTFRVRIRAEAGGDSPTGGGHADQEYTLRVLNGRPSVLRGAVRNLSGQGISNVRLRLFEGGTNHFLFSATSDSAGRYAFPAVNAGTFLLRAQPRDNSIYASQWYDRARCIQDATPISVPESSTVIINVTLLLRDSANVTFNLSGNVSDTSNAPLRQARVSIFRARQHGDLDNSGLNFEGLDSHHRDQELEARVLTDSNGNYRVRLRPRRYIIMAEKEGYDQQFWDHKSTALDADRLNLIRDTTGIDFDLRRQQAATGSIAGRISTAGDTNGVRAHVIGFHRSTPNGNFSGFIREAQTDSLGRYALPQLRSGYYIVLAVPQGEFLPTFYDTTGGTINLSRAFPVPVTNSLVNNINIRVFPDTVTGMNRVRGVATAVYDLVEGAVPLAGTIVYAVSTEDNAVVGAAVSERNGTYTLVGIAPGSYFLNAVKPGYTQSAAPSVSVTQIGTLPTTVLQSVLLISTPTGVGERGTPVDFALEQNYPNPFNPTTEIRYQIPEVRSQISEVSHVTLKVYDVLGREVATLVNEELKAGSYEKTFSAEGLSSGVYFYKLKSGNLSETRKMLLMK